MTEDGRSEIDTWLAQAESIRCRLLLLVRRAACRLDPADLSGDWQGNASINLSLDLSRRLLDLPLHRRASQAPIILADLLAGQEAVLLYNIELLFDPILQLDPLRVLKAASRSRSLAVFWPGLYEDGRLTYAEPGHPEFRRYAESDLAEILVVPVT